MSLNAQRCSPVSHRAVLLVAAAAFAIAAFMYNLVAGAVACSYDNSYCAYSSDKEGFYSGPVWGRGGRPLLNREVPLHFASRQDLAPVKLSTDAAGRMCFFWARERVSPQRGLRWHSLARRRPPSGCRSLDVGVPWNRAVDVRSAWQYLSVLTLTGAAIVLMAAALFFRRRLRSTLLWLGGAAAVAGLGLCVAVWA